LRSPPSATRRSTGSCPRRSTPSSPTSSRPCRPTPSAASRLDALVPDLVEALPPDPFSGKPLLYRTEKSGFLVYSVGENGKDDQGDIERANGKQPDIGFRYIRPKAQF